MEKKASLWRENKEGQPKRRHNLSELLPMKEPISIDIEASSACCLKCRYCPQSLSADEKKHINIGNNGVMDMTLFVQVVEQLKEFGGPLKNIRFAGFGEPLLNPGIVEMVDYLRNGGCRKPLRFFRTGFR